VTTTDGIDALAGMIRRQVQALRGTAGASRAAPAGGTGKAAPRGPARRGADAKAPARDLAAVIARRVQAIDAADPDAGRRAFRLFLESVLLLELGEDLINDPAFYQLVDDVEGQMRADTELAPLMERAGDLLLERSEDK